jgi:hypothetical protein
MAGIEAVAVYRKRERRMLPGSPCRASRAWRVWLVLRLPGGRLEAIGVSALAFRALRRAGVPLSRQNVHAMRGDLARPL